MTLVEMIPALTPMAIMGISNRWWLLGAVIVLGLLVLVMAVSRRSRGPKLEITALPADQATRYLAEMDACEASFVDNPQQAAARARGLVEEVMRRKGFPDRIEPDQRLSDLQKHDRVAAQAMKDAYSGIRGNAETENLRKAVQNYRDALRRLLREEGTAVGSGPVSPEATVS